jgi:hypothetical protein
LRKNKENAEAKGEKKERHRPRNGSVKVNTKRKTDAKGEKKNRDQQTEV